MLRSIINKDINCIVFDPPRKGIDRQVLDCVIKNKINNIIYVSCNPATLARDLGILEKWYEIKKISLVDMFCYSSGIESVCLLTERNGNTKYN